MKKIFLRNVYCERSISEKKQRNFWLEINSVQNISDNWTV